MQINSVSNLIPQAAQRASSSGFGADSTTTSKPSEDTQSMFMKLLTAQLEHQSPLNPVDPMQFTSELVQFNMLSQLTQINSVLQQGMESVKSASTGGN